MGLHLKYTLSARGGDAGGGELRADAHALLSLLTWLRDEELLEDRGCAEYSLVMADSQVVQGDHGYGLDELLERMGQATADENPRILNVWALRTSDHFPNPFVQYTQGEGALSSWLSVRVVSGSTAASRGFELEFTEVGFLDDDPRMALTTLDRKMQSIIGTRVTCGCFSLEPEQETA